MLQWQQFFFSQFGFTYPYFLLRTCLKNYCANFLLEDGTIFLAIWLFARVPLQEIVGIGTLNLFLNSLAEKRTMEDASADKRCCGFHSRWVSTSLLSCPTGFLHMLSHGRARNSSVLWIRCWQRLPRRLTTRVLSHRVLFLESISHVACEWVPGVVSIPVWSWHHIVHVMGVCSAVSSHKIYL